MVAPEGGREPASTVVQDPGLAADLGEILWGH